MLKINDLKWDSSFFNKKIGKVEITDEVFNIEEHLLKSYDLIYIFSSQKLKNNETSTLVDEKVTYFKKIEKSEDHSEILFYDNNCHEQLIKLGLQSGKYSRFNLDPNFVNNEYENLYTQWVNNSISNADTEIIIEEFENLVVGFVTVVKNNAAQGEIGLVAVDEAHRGKGIAKKLMKQALAYFYKNNIKEVRVVTQLFNKPACKLYESVGFEIEDVKYIYHHWTNTNILNK
ncbi:GNAT family N-acetyltransferase [Chryseobacterium chendengshani]|uniref:GNAT family N-acetyltransferase n=1 Tax=Chryseobacterium sp. LJ668 TaxID=2864040 RepID=UPI001C68C05D|nr:GNAT family N-acetyltransferase [Chryseobacterium sp. LJ668]MBW8523163.1 GNAT family N-acetyltransferase [Chryseobacterium sp. LJ668]QYK15460.1 GNAT family N-acetyltransferase [Chryseobacterium sp. LJ668]